MDPAIVAAIIGALATVAAAVIGREWGKRKGREEKQQEIDDAPRKYVDHLETLILTGTREGRSNAVLNARAIVSTRNDLRGSMMRISEILNSDIDRLGSAVSNVPGPNPANAEMESYIFETIQVLERKWPAKKDQVEVELRKVLAELGILGRSPNRPG